jgi:hypothetical protein
MALNYDTESGNATRDAAASTAKVTTGEATVMGTTMTRSAMWLLAACSSVILVGHAGVLRANGLINDETMAILIFGLVGLIIGIAGLMLERLAPSVVENQLIVTLAGVALLGSGLGTVLTILLGTLEVIGIALGAAGLALIGSSLLGSHVDFIKTRIQASTSNTRNGASAAWLVVSLVIYTVVACINLGNYLNNNGPKFGLIYDLMVSGVAVGILCMIAAKAGVLMGSRLGDREPWFYLLLTVVLVIGASIFPLAGYTKPISSAVSLFAAVYFSAQVTRALFQ